MEVDVSHPALFEREDTEQEQGEGGGGGGMGMGAGMRLAEWRRDLAGNPRFCCWALDLEARG